jgi:hypothetical protein
LTYVFDRSKERRTGVQFDVDAALGLRLPDGQAVSATDLKAWQCKEDLALSWQAKGATGTLTLAIPLHDYRMILVAPAEAAK